MSFKFLVLAWFSLTSLSAADFRLGIVDFNRALNNVEEGKTAKAKLQKDFDEKKKSLDAKNEKLKGMAKQLDELKTKMQSNLLNEAEQKRARKLDEEAAKLGTELAEEWKKNKDELIQKESAVTQEIIRKLRVVMEDLGRAGAFTMVLEKNESGLVYANEATDLTEKLIQKYNSQYKGN